MRVIPIEGERFRFFVQSDTAPDTQYLTDLEECDGVGMCDCPHWRCRLAKRIAKGERVRCKHTEAAREFALDREIQMHQEEQALVHRRR